MAFDIDLHLDSACIRVYTLGLTRRRSCLVSVAAEWVPFSTYDCWSLLLWYLVQIVKDWWKRSASTTCRTACWTRCATTARTTPPPSVSCSPAPSVSCRSCAPSAVSASTGCVPSSTRAWPNSQPPSPRLHPSWLPPRCPAATYLFSRPSRRRGGVIRD